MPIWQLNWLTRLTPNMCRSNLVASALEKGQGNGRYQEARANFDVPFSLMPANVLDTSIDFSFLCLPSSEKPFCCQPDMIKAKEVGRTKSQKQSLIALPLISKEKQNQRTSVTCVHVYLKSYPFRMRRSEKTGNRRRQRDKACQPRLFQREKHIRGCSALHRDKESRYFSFSLTMLLGPQT